jgi:predicted amidohydrolase
MKVTVCEMGDDREKFAEDWVRLARHVGREGSDLVLLPEMPFYHWFPAAPKFDPEVWGEAVAEHRLWGRRLGELGAPVVLGTAPVEKGGRRLNEGFVWTKKGGARGVQPKNYLPDEPGYYEASWYDRGDRKFSTFDVGAWRGGFLICSDLWSMASARAYGKEGAHLIAEPRCTGRGSVEKWLAGGKVAAVVSGAYSLSSNRVGKRGPAEFGGRGWVVDPNGNVLGLTSKSKPFVTAKVDVKAADAAKKSYPRDSLEPD